MRNKRTKLEEWAIAQLMPLLESEGDQWSEDPNVHDAPDLVLYDSEGKRIACEITTVGLNEWHCWANDPNMKLDFSELDEIVCPREPDYWLKMVLSSKNSRIPDYLRNANASEAWLLVHGDMHDFFVLDDDTYDVPVLQGVAESESHQFARIYIASPRSKPRSIVRVYPPNSDVPAAPDLSRLANIKMMKIRSMKLDVSKGGVITAAIGMEFKPDRQLVLPILDTTRR